MIFSHITKNLLRKKDQDILHLSEKSLIARNKEAKSSETVPNTQDLVHIETAGVKGLFGPHSGSNYKQDIFYSYFVGSLRSKV